MTGYHLGIVLGLTSAVTFVVLSLWSREIQHRGGPWRYLFYINAAPALVGVVSWLFVPPSFSWPLLRGVLLAAAPATLGLFFMGLAVRYGDVSHVGPVMGSKALVVTVLAVGFGFEPVRQEFWLAAGILLAALFLVSGNREVLRRPWRIVEPALVFGLLMCTFASLADLITRQQMHDHHLAVWEFLTVGWLVRGTFCGTILVIVCLVRRLPILPRRAGTFWVTGPIVMVHGAIIVGAFKLTNSAVLTNVLTSFRGVVSVLAVLLLAKLNIGRKERLTRSMVVVRVVGSLLVCGAVWLALAGREEPGTEADKRPTAQDTSSPAREPATGRAFSVHGPAVRPPDTSDRHEPPSAG